jgi:gamma-glutamyltranspeptidase/glutathione hydrolase
LYGGKPKIVIGSGGSARIRTAILQVVLNLISHGLTPQEAVDHPRIHWEGHLLSAEPGLLDVGEAFSLAGSRVHFWEEKNMFFGGTHMAYQDENGMLTGAADARRSGVVMSS